jgi:hypothetical protein
MSFHIWDNSFGGVNYSTDVHGMRDVPVSVVIFGTVFVTIRGPDPSVRHENIDTP